jgi:DNA polymerase-3 subunit delta'
MNLPWLDEAGSQFIRQLQAGRQPHAVLLSGPAGLGKLELARSMSAALLCLQPQTGSATTLDDLACGRCRSCQYFAGGAHPDFRMVTFAPKKNSEELSTVITVDQVRELIASMQLTNGLSPRKVALVHPAEAMNRNAANALLKTLEEPVGAVVLLLVSHDASRLSATIRSRCQAMHLRPPSRPEALQWLRDQKGAVAEDAELALLAAAGSPLHAAQLLHEGRVDAFRRIIQQLQLISRDGQAVGAAYDQLFQLDPSELWRWLSVASAERVRSLHGIGTGEGGAAASRQVQQQFAGLYRAANHNRRLVSTPVRKDLLLRDWLIQWSATTSS